MAEVNPALVINGQPIQYNFYALEDTLATARVKTGRGFLHALTVTGGTTGGIVLYDNTENSGTVIANFATTNTAETFVFDTVFITGLTVSSMGVDSPRLTIAYR